MIASRTSGSELQVSMNSRATSEASEAENPLAREATREADKSSNEEGDEGDSDVHFK